MPIAVSSASLPSLSPFELIDLAAAAGYGGVEWRVASTDLIDARQPWHFQTNNRCTVAATRQAMADIRRACERAGLHIVGLSPYIAVGDVDGGARLIELAAEAGAQRVRLWAPRPGDAPYAESFDRMRRFVDALLPVAQRHQVELAVEQHQNTICSSASLAMRLACLYAPHELGVIYDIGNLAVEGYEHPAIALDLIGRHLRHVQVKNAALQPGGPGQGWQWRWCPMEDGVLALASILAVLGARGFSDWISVEDFSTEWPDPQKLSHNKALVERWFTTPITPQPA